MVLLRIPLLISASITLTSAFTTSPPNARYATNLQDVIKGEAVDSVPLNENLGGVGLAKRCAIKISGTAKKGGNADSDILNDLTRYERMQGVDDADAKSALEKLGCKVICSGMGKELYYFPNDSARYEDKVIKLAPEEAAKDALTRASSASNAKYVVVNFLGGDDLIYGEVKDACDLLVDELEISDKAKITFNSVSFTDFEEGVCSVTVIASDGQSGEDGGVEQSIGRGEAYIYDGKWYTLTKEDITTASD